MSCLGTEHVALWGDKGTGVAFCLTGDLRSIHPPRGHRARCRRLLPVFQVAPILGGGKHRPSDRAPQSSPLQRPKSDHLADSFREPAEWG